MLPVEGYGEINYRDRALIVTILLAIVIILRLIQVVLALASLRRRESKPVFFVTPRDVHSQHHGIHTRGIDITTRA